MRLLSNLLRTFIKKGRLDLFDVDGKLHSFGSGEDGPIVTMRLHDKKLYWELFINPELKAAEAYMDGTMTFENGSGCYDLMYLFSVNRSGLGSHAVQGMLRKGWKALRRRQQMNDVANAKKQARQHYDLSTDLYRLFLDEKLNYSCAYFADPAMSLEEAQDAKLRHAVTKLGLKPGMRVCEIGGGWGAFAIALAKAGADVVSLNVSPEQVRIAQEKTEQAGVADRVNYVIKDYREYEGSFDRVVSVGMMEHVGIGHFDEYFGKVKDLLTPDGYAFIHSIGRMSPPGTTAPFFRKYIFPGGYTPALSETCEVLERLGLWVCDVGGAATALLLHGQALARAFRSQSREGS